MFNNGAFSQQRLSERTRPQTPVEAILVGPPPTPGVLELFQKASASDDPLFAAPVKKWRGPEGGRTVGGDEGLEEIVIDSDKLPPKKDSGDYSGTLKNSEKNPKITTFDGLLRRMKLLPKKAAAVEQPTKPKPPAVSKKEAARRRKKRIKSLQRKAKRRLKKCWNIVTRFINSILAIITRSMYILHAILTVWRVTVLIGEWYWVITGWLGFMVLECLVVQFKRGGKEWKWIQPCILIYLMVELPSILILEVINVHDLQISRNMSQPILGDILNKHREQIGENVEEITVAGIGSIAADTWNLLLEQSMLVLIIIARWMMPKGDMTRDQLSGLLLFYLGTASDIVDFFSVISEDEDLVVGNYTFLFTILVFWGWSMFQFVFLVTMTKGDDDEHAAEEKKDDDASDAENEEAMKKKKEAEKQHIIKHMSKDHHEDDDDEKHLTCPERAEKNIKVFLASEVWAILVSVIFQDLPFACVRVICVFYWNIKTYTNYFFTFKNIMILILQIYRLVAVYQEHRKAERELKLQKKKARQLAWQAAIEAAKSGGLLSKLRDKGMLAKPVGAARPFPQAYVPQAGILRQRKNTPKSKTRPARKVTFRSNSPIKRVTKTKKMPRNKVGISDKPNYNDSSDISNMEVQIGGSINSNNMETIDERQEPINTKRHDQYFLNMINYSSSSSSDSEDSDTDYMENNVKISANETCKLPGGLTISRSFPDDCHIENCNNQFGAFTETSTEQPDCFVNINKNEDINNESHIVTVRDYSATNRIFHTVDSGVLTDVSII